MSILDDIWGNIKGTFVQRPEDKAWYDPAFNQYKPNQYGGYGDSYGPPDMSSGKVPPLNVVTAPTPDVLGSVGNAVGGAVNGVASAVGNGIGSALNSNQVLKFGLIGLGVFAVIKILK